MENSVEQFDVIVIGAGIMGSCTAYEIAKRGRKVLLLEQFDFLHQRGSSHGESRTIRTTYPEPYYSSMVLESSRLWEQAQSEIGYRVYSKTLHFDMGPPDNKSLLSVIANCKSTSTPHQILDPQQVSDSFSGVFNLPDNWVGVITETGGVIKPTKAVSMFQSLAVKLGATLRDNVEVKKLQRDKEMGGIRAYADGGKRFWGRKCVVTAGAWMKKLVEQVSGQMLPIQPLHTTICYWKIKEEHQREFSPESGFPTFASYGNPYIYGTPMMEYPGLVKVAVHGGYPCDPDKRNWGADVEMLGRGLAEWIEGRFSGRVETGTGPVLTQACMYSMTPDGDFVIDFLGGEFGEEVVVAGGFSGHGFKMGPVVGRMVAEMVVDGEVVGGGVEMRHFRLGRFLENPKGNVKEYEDQVSSILF